MKVIRTEYTLFPAQYEFCYSDKIKKRIVEAKKENKTYQDVALYQGGVGSGKTFVGSLRGLLLALHYDGIRGLVGAKSQDLLDNTTKRAYLDRMKEIGLKEGVHWTFTDRKQAIQFINGSLVRFKTLSDWETFMSDDFGFIEFEEASFIEEIVFLKLISRLRQPVNPNWDEDFCRCFFLHTNPQGKRGWLNKYFINPRTKKDSFRYIHASTRENTFLGKEYVDMLEETYSEDQIKEMVEGLDLDYDNTVAFPNFSELNVKEHIDYNPNANLILSCDFNYNPMCWYLMQEYDNCWYILKEFIGQSCTTEQMCKMIIPELNRYDTRRLVIAGDAHGRDKKTNGSDYNTMFQSFDKFGWTVNFRVQKANPLIKERLAVVRGLICNAKGVRRIFIDQSCSKLIYNFDECKNNLANGGLRIPTDKEIQDDPNKLYLVHPIDAVTYPMWYLYQLRSNIDENERM
jgi:PBSX family phage terminase large subunit